MSNGGRNPSGRFENKIKRYLFRFEQSTNPKNKKHIVGCIVKTCRAYGRGTILGVTE